jgi:hypothetical protein
MHQIADLTRTTRGRLHWDDEFLVDTVAAAESIEAELKAEKQRMDNMIKSESPSDMSEACYSSR